MRMRNRVLLVLAALQTVFWIVVLLVDPFGMSSAADRGSESIFLKLYSFAYPNFAPAQTASDIVVVLYTENDLPQKSQWPLTFGQHGQLVSALLAAHPKAVFLDLLFDTDKERAPGDKPQALLDAVKPGSAPVFFASYAAGKGMLVKPLRDLPAMGFDGGPQGAGAFRAIVQRNAEFGHYPLAMRNGSRDELSPAAALYQKVAGADPKVKLDGGTQDMLVAWGSTWPSRYQQDRPDCEKYFDTRWERIKGLFKALRIAFFNKAFGDANEGGKWNMLQPCPYHDAISAGAVFQPGNQEELRRMVEGKYVLVGAQIGGIEDFVVSPVNGRLPGVYLHAMALDNLLAFAGQPIRTSESYWIIQAILIFASMVAGILLFDERKFPRTRAGALREIAVRLAYWLGFAVFSAVLLFAGLVWLHWAPYNWGAVFAIAGGAFLAGSGKLVLFLVLGKKHFKEAHLEAG